MLLARYAEALFWYGRYIERAESLARILNVQAGFATRIEDANAWAAVLSLYANEELFHEAYDEASPENIIRYFVSDRENPGSILSSLRAARENARMLRPLLSVSQWSYLNMFYNRFSKAGPHDLDSIHLARTSASVVEGCVALKGLAEASHYRDESWHFYQLGLWLERADQTSRLFDVNFAQLRDEVQDSDRSDAELWHVVLHSCEAYHSYLRTQGSKFKPRRAAALLVFDEKFPRSVSYCLHKLKFGLDELYRVYGFSKALKACEQASDLVERLDPLARDEQLFANFHEFSDQMQLRLAQLADELGNCFFARELQLAEASDAEAGEADNAQSETSGGSTQSQKQSGDGAQSQE